MSAATHAPKLKRQAEAVFYSFRFVFFWNEYPWSAWTGFLDGR